MSYLSRRFWPISKGIQNSKEIAFLNMREAAGDAALDKLWADTFKDDTGIDAGNSLRYGYDAGNQEVDHDPELADLQNNAGDETADASLEWGTSGSAVERRAAQSFQLSAGEAAITIKGIQAYIKSQVGGNSGDVIVRIETDNAGNPSGTLAHANATGTIAAFVNSSTYAWKECEFSSGFTLSASTTYWLVLLRTSTTNSTGYNWAVDTGNFYASGNANQYSATWSPAAGNDAFFKIMQASSAGALVQSIRALDLAVNITEVIAFAEVTGGSISLVEVSTDDGATWTTVALETIASVPAGMQVKIRVTFTGSLQYMGVAA